jgi:hypothetical protein
MQGNTTHLSGDVATSSVGAANGVAPLGTDTKVFVNYLPFGDQHHYGIMQMSTDTPQPLGIATAGTSGYPADGAHVHALPSGSLVQLWAYNPSSPTTVSTTSGPVAMTPGGGSFTTPADGAVLEVLFNVQFGASNVNVANCVADISLSGYPPSAYGTAGYAQPSYAFGGYVSTSAQALYTLYGSTTYTVTPRVAAVGTGATCIVSGASMWMREFVP